MSVAFNPLTMAGDLVLKVPEIVGPGIGILGQSGFGKSTTVRRFAEQCLKAGLPFSLLDIEDEYFSLKEVGNVVLAGPVGNDVAPLDVRIENEAQAYKLGKKAYLERRSVIFLLAELDEETREDFVLAYTRGVFDAAHNVASRWIHFFVVEECQEYVPQTGIDKSNPLRKMLIRLSKRGRKRGIFPVWSSQRAADVDKNVLTQCQVFFLHCVTWSNDLNTYKTLLPPEEIDRVQAMRPGEVYFRQGKRIQRTTIALPVTKSPSVTPGADSVTLDPSHYQQVADAASIQQEVSASTEAEGGVSAIPTVELRMLQSKVPLLEHQVSELSAELILARTKLNEVLQMTQEDRDHLQVIGDLNAELKAVKAERDRLAVEAAPLRLIRNMLREEMNGNGKSG